jgi:diketogulonate reductase-like aldo/keto reductase
MAVPNLKMNNGAKIPQVGLGLWLNKDEQSCRDSVKWALEAGYSHFDSAQAYDNEQFLGEALRESDVKRSDVFVTTKIAVKNFGYHRAPKSFKASLEKLQMEYVDLLLLHFPVSLLRGKSWKALEEIHAAGQAKAIGVSNYTIHHLEELLKDCKVRPVVNQVELHVYLQQPKLLEYCRKNNIVVEAYSPLSHGKRMKDPILAGLAKKHGKSIAQIMIRWCIEVGTVPLPKSAHKERIKENLDVFDFTLDKQDMTELTKLDENFRTCWDPTHVP